MNLLPDPAYNGEPHVQIFQESIGQQVTAIKKARDDMKKQARPSTSSDWGISNYERAWGLAVDNNRPFEQRLAIWRARRRGIGTITAEVIKNIASSFHNGGIEVIDHKKEFWFEIILKSNHGTIEIITDLQAAINEIIPAHLGISFISIAEFETMPATLYLAPAFPASVMTTALPEIQPGAFDTSVNILSAHSSLSETRLSELPDVPRKAYIRDSKTGAVHEAYISDESSDIHPAYIQTRKKGEANG